ncbi:MAG: oligosaccharide flippase family protein [Weeksellaceae bacterium]|nr:oligosaccharide flippase family protein [Weeksellaceae bacterium]
MRIFQHPVFQKFSTSYAKGTISLFAGLSLSRVILALGGLVLARWYGAEHFAVYSVFLSLAMILPVIGNLRLEQMLLLLQPRSDIRNLFSFTFLISTLIISVITLGMWVIQKVGFQVSNLNTGWLFLSGVGAIFFAWNLNQQAVLVKLSKYKYMAAAYLVGAVVTIAAQILFYMLDNQEGGLIYGWILGVVATAIFLAFFTAKEIKIPQIPAVKSILNAQRRILYFTLPSDIIHTVANNILPILLIMFFPKQEVGVFALAYKILTTPLFLITSSVSQVFLRKAAELKDQKPWMLHRLTMRLTLYATAVMALFVLLANTIGLYFLLWFYDSEWNSLALFIPILSVLIVARSVSAVILPVTLVINKNHYALYFNCTLLLINLLAIYLGYIYSSFTIALAAFSLLSALAYLVLMISVKSSLNRYSHRVAA